MDGKEAKNETLRLTELHSTAVRFWIHHKVDAAASTSATCADGGSIFICRGGLLTSSKLDPATVLANTVV